MSKARLLVELEVKLGQVDSFVDMFRKQFIARSRQEEGCEQYEMWSDPKDPTKMTIVEVWSSRADLDRHLAQAWFSVWAPQLEAAQAKPLIVRDMLSVED